MQENTNEQTQQTQQAHEGAIEQQQNFAQEQKAEVFLPAQFLTNALAEAGHENPQAWQRDLDSRCNDTTLKPEERIFFVNRALRLYMSEQEGRNHMEARMLLADGLTVEEWSAIVVRGVVPWLLNKLPLNKTQLAQAAAAVSSHAEQSIEANEPQAQEQATEQAQQ